MEEIKITDSSWSQYTKEKKQIIFSPKVASQRYNIVHELLTKENWKDKIISVTEYGCANLKFFPYLKNIPGVEKINLVDIDDHLLKERQEFVNPLLYDHLNKRSNPLSVKVFQGSISDPDSRILKSDAVIGIEIIEHLFPDTLEAVPYVIFHTIKPKIVIFTTPNADFNVALPNFKIFRHSDHKFEWTREQFEAWALNITLRFPDYIVKFFGVGRGPKGTSLLGCCSQLCLFIRKDLLGLPYSTEKLLPCCEKSMFLNSCKDKSNLCPNCFPSQPFGICKYMTNTKIFEEYDQNLFFTLLKESVYPSEEKIVKTKEEHILESLEHRIFDHSFHPMDEDDVEKIPLYTIARYIKDLKITVDEIRDVLTSHGYEVKDCLVRDFNNPENDEWEPCVLYQRPATPSSESSCSEENQEESHETSLTYYDPIEAEDWDAETT